MNLFEQMMNENRKFSKKRIKEGLESEVLRFNKPFTLRPNGSWMYDSTKEDPRNYLEHIITVYESPNGRYFVNILLDPNYEDEDFQKRAETTEFDYDTDDMNKMVSLVNTVLKELDTLSYYEDAEEFIDSLISEKSY